MSILNLEKQIGEFILKKAEELSNDEGRIKGLTLHYGNMFKSAVGKKNLSLRWRDSDKECIRLLSMLSYFCGGYNASWPGNVGRLDDELTVEQAIDRLNGEFSRERNQ